MVLVGAELPNQLNAGDIERGAVSVLPCAVNRLSISRYAVSQRLDFARYALEDIVD